MSFLPLLNGISDNKMLLILAVAAALVLIIAFALKKKRGADSQPDEAAQVCESLSEEAVASASDNAEIAQEQEEKTDIASTIPHIPGYVVLDGVKEQDAAVIMAITSEKTGIALDHLDFKSIKRLNQDPVLENIEEQDAAAIMAITSDKTGIPLENLIFNSIKLVED